MSVPDIVYLVRHGHAASVGPWIAGWTPGIHLDRVGRAQARAAARRLSDIRLNAVYSSPLERACETAQIIAAEQHVPVRVDHRFGEFDWGEWTGLGLDVLRDNAAFRFFNSVRSQAGAPGGETATAAQTRIVAALAEITRRHAGSPVAIVSHADMIRYALAHGRGLSLDHVLEIDVQPGAVFALAVDAIQRAGR